MAHACGKHIKIHNLFFKYIRLLGAIFSEITSNNFDLKKIHKE